MDIGHALGALLAVLPAAAAGAGRTAARRARFRAAFVLLRAAAGGSACRSTPACRRRREAPRDGAAQSHRSPQSRRILWRISALFGLDALAGGFLAGSLLSYFFFERFGVSAAVIGALFFGARCLNAVSHLAAAWLAERIGLVNTMVFTHIPSSLLLVTVAFAPDFRMAAHPVPAARGAGGDGRADAPVLRHGGGAAARSAPSPPASRTWCGSAAGRSAPGFAGVLMQARGAGDAAADRCRHEDRLRRPALCRFSQGETAGGILKRMRTVFDDRPRTGC